MALWGDFETLRGSDITGGIRRMGHWEWSVGLGWPVSYLVSWSTEQAVHALGAIAASYSNHCVFPTPSNHEPKWVLLFKLPCISCLVSTLRKVMNIRSQQCKCWGHLHTETTEGRMTRSDKEPAAAARASETRSCHPRIGCPGSSVGAVDSSGPIGINWKVKQANTHP